MSFRENRTDNNPLKKENGVKRKRILFTLGSLEEGGAERVVINLLRHLDRSKFELHLAVVHYFGFFIEALPEDIIIHDLKARRVRKSFLPFIRLFRRLKPDVIFSTLGYLNLAVILLKPVIPRQTRIIVRETSIATENLREVPYSRLWKWLYRFLYNRADNIVCLCEWMSQDLVEHFGVDPKRIIRIFNPVDIEEVRLLADQGENPFSSYGEGPHLVAVGRLVSAKGFDRLIRAFQSLSARKPKARLWILGKGELENQLKELINGLDLKEKVFLAGFQKNPFLWLKHADLFVLSSLFEGLPNTLLEALACDCPIVALRHSGGTEEMLGMLGLDDRFVDSLDIWPEAWWERPLDKISDLLINNFGRVKITKEYESLFLRVLK